MMRDMRATKNPTRELLFWLFFLVAQGLQVVAGSRADILKGKHGESACTLKDNMYKGCPLTPPSTFNATFETPAACTCNKIFFNIWSACSYSAGINVLPILQDWQSLCFSSGINLEQAAALAERNPWGVDPPSWAKIDVPGNATMDFQNAVLKAKPAPSWTLLQIVLPIITAAVAIVLTLVVMLIYHKRRERAEWGGRVRRLVRPIPRVQDVQKHDSWEIESSVDDARRYELSAGSYPFSPSASTQVQGQRGFGGHGGESSTSESSSFYVDDPVGRRSSTDSWRVPSSLKSLQMPWMMMKKGGRKKNRVQEVNATTEFDIDDYDLTPTSSRFGINEGDGGGGSGHRRVGSGGNEGDERSGLMASTDRPPTTPQVPVASPAETPLSYSDPFGEPTR